MICEPKHVTTSFCFFSSKVVKQPFFSCTIGLNIHIFFFFAIFYPAKLKKYIMAACLFLFFFLFISKFTNKKVH